MAGNLGKKRPGAGYTKTHVPHPKSPSTHARQEHAGRVPQPGVPSGPRQTVPAKPSSPAARKPIYNPSTGHYEPSPTVRREHKGKVPGAGGLHGAAGANAAHKLNAAAYHQHALEQIAAKSYKIVNGTVKTKTEHVPTLKSSPKELVQAEQHLDHLLTQAKRKGAPKDWLKKAQRAGEEEIVRHHYKITKKGRVATHPVEVPVLKVKPKKIREELRHVNKVTKQIASGQRPYTFRAPTEHRTWATPIGEAVGGVVSDIPGAVAKTADEITSVVVPGPAGQPAKKVHAGREIAKDYAKAYGGAARGVGRYLNAAQLQQDQQLRQSGLGFAVSARKDVFKGVRTGLLGGAEALTRPGKAIEQQFARELAGDLGPLNVIGKGLPALAGKAFLTPKARKEFAKANPLEAILHGHNAKNLITGGDLGEQLFGLRQLGLPIDLATDPLMYVGGAGLLAKFGERGAAIYERLVKYAPDALKDPAVTNAIKHAQDSGDWEAAMKLFERKAEEHGVSLKRLTKTKADKAAIKKHIIIPRLNRDKEVFASTLADRQAAEKIGKKPVYMGGVADTRATEQQVRKFLEKRLRPGFELELRTPFGKRVAGIGVPLPRKLAERRFIPTPAMAEGFTNTLTEKAKMLRTIRESEAQEPIYMAVANEYQKRFDAMEKLTYGSKEYRAAKAEFDNFDAQVQGILLDARLRAGGENLGKISPAEWISRYNTRRFHHQIAAFTRNKGRALQQIAMGFAKEAVAPILHDDNARIRVGLAMHAKHDTGAQAILARAFTLTDKEQQVVRDLEKVYNEMERYGLAVNTLPYGGIEDYVPRYTSPSENIFAGLHDAPKSEEVLPMGGAAGSEAAYMRHRGLFEMASLSDKTRLTKAIETVANKPLKPGEAAEIAEQWYQMGRVHLVLEDMVHAVQRGTILKWEDLTPIQRKAYEWQARQRSKGEMIPPVFKEVGSTDGRLVLDPEGVAYQRDLVEIPFDGLSTDAEHMARLSSIIESRQKLREAEELARRDNPQLADEYAQIVAQRDSELSQAKEAYKPSRLTPTTATQDQGIPVRDVGNDLPPSPAAEGSSFWDRQPFMYDPENKEILLGKRGEMHGDNPEMEALMHDKPYVQGEIFHDPNTPVFKYGLVDTKKAEEPAVREALRQHTGLDLRSYDEWRAAEQTPPAEKPLSTATVDPNAKRVWTKKGKGVSIYTSKHGEMIAKNKDGEWMLTRKPGQPPEPYPTRKAAIEAAEPAPPPDIGAMEAEHQAITEKALPQAQKELGELQQQVGSQQYVLALKNPDGSVSRYLKTQYATPAEAEQALSAALDAGNLPKGQYLDVVEDPTTSAASRKEAAEGYAKKAEHIESMETEAENLKRQIDELSKEPGKAAEQVTTKMRTEPPPPTIDGAEAPVAAEVGLPSDEEIANMVPNATKEFLGTTRDFRKDHAGEFPIIDPLLANFHRTRAEGLQTVFRTRWAAIDKAVGRSTIEAKAGRWTAIDGRSGFVGDLKPVIPEDGVEPTGYIVRDTGDEIAAHNIEFHDRRTLIPMGDRAIWIDPVTGREYVHATQLEPRVAGPITQMIGKDRLWPTDVIANARFEFMKFGETGVRDLYDAGYTGIYNRVLSLTRYGVTTLFPAYHFRNMISDVIQSMMGDQGILFHPAGYTALAAKVMLRGKPIRIPLVGKLAGKDIEIGLGYVKLPGWGKISVEDYLATMDAFGLRSNQHMAELAILAERGNVKATHGWIGRVTEFGKQGLGLGPSGIIGRNMIEFGARREDIMRVITFTQRMKRNGGDFADAAWWTIKHHFDYGDLNLMERRVIRNLFLFYTWYRKNIPLQFSTMIRRPGFFSALTNTYIGVSQGETPFNFDWSKINPLLPNMEGPMPHSGLVPDYMFNQLAAIGTNWNGHAVVAGFGAPYADLNLIFHTLESPEEGVRIAGGLLNPLATTAAQFAFKTDLLTGRKFSERESSGGAQFVNFIAEKFGFQLPTDESGNPTLPWAANLIFNTLPVVGRASGYLRPTSITEDQGRFNQAFGGSGWGSFLTGINAYVSPGGGERLKLAYINRVMAWGMQRKALAESLTHEKPSAAEAKLNQFDEQVRERAKLLGIPFKAFEVVPAGWKFYKTQEEREGFHLNPEEGGELGGLSGEGGLTLPKHREYHGLSEEALEKWQHPGAFEEFHINEGGFFPGSTGGSSIPGGEYTGATQPGLRKVAGKAGITPSHGVTPAPSGGNLGKQHPGATVSRVKGKPNAAERALNSSGVQELLAQAKTKTQKQDVKRFLKLKDKMDSKLTPKIGPLPTGGGSTEFAKWFSHYSGMDPRVVGAWVIAEGAGESGTTGGEAGLNNWLAAGYPAHKTSFSEASFFNGSPKRAAKATVEWMQGKIGGEYNYPASSGIQNALREAPGKSPQEQARILASSGWVDGNEGVLNSSYYNSIVSNMSQVQITGHSGHVSPKLRSEVKQAEAAVRAYGLKPQKILARHEEGPGAVAVGKGQKKYFVKADGTEHLRFVPLLTRQLIKLSKASGEPIVVNSGFRTYQEQVESWNDYKNGGALAAEPGTSNHEFGLAADLELSDKQRALLSKFGLGLPVPGEDWHVEIVDPTMKAKAEAQSAKKLTGVASAGATSAGGGTYAPGGGGGEITPGYHPGRAANQDKLLQRIMEGKAVGGAGGTSGSSGGIAGNPLLTNTEAYNLGSGGGKRPGQAIVEEAQKEVERAGKYFGGERAKTPRYRGKIR